MENIYLAHGGKELVIGGKVTLLDSASVDGGIIAHLPDSNATTVAALRNDFNELLAALRRSGLVRPDPDGDMGAALDAVVDAPAEAGDAE